MKTFYHLFKSSSVTTSPKLIKQIVTDINDINLDYLNSHVFLIYGDKTTHYNFLEKRKIRFHFFNSQFSLIRFLFKKKDIRVVVHGLPVKNIFFYFFLIGIKMKNISWINWGHGHVYGKKRIVSYLIDRLLINKLNCIVALTKHDLMLIENVFSKVNTIFLPYKSKQIENLITNDIIYKGNNDFNIMIGVSGGVPQRHQLGIELIAKLKLEQITVFSPLSYNNQDKEYIQRIKNLGFKLLSDKFIPIEQLMTSDKYLEFLGTIDVLILPSNKQNGLFNIYALLFLGKKVFVPKGSNLYLSLKELGFKVESLDSLNQTTLISHYDDSIKNSNKQVLRNMYNHDENLAKWTEFYETLFDNEKKN